jgi:hypothetical protein
MSIEKKVGNAILRFLICSAPGASAVLRALKTSGIVGFCLDFHGTDEVFYKSPGSNNNSTLESLECSTG